MRAILGTNIQLHTKCANRPFLVRVEGVHVVHDELAAPQQAVAWAVLVAELARDLVHSAGQLSPTGGAQAHQLRELLLVGGAQAEPAEKETSAARQGFGEYSLVR